MIRPFRQLLFFAVFILASGCRTEESPVSRPTQQALHAKGIVESSEARTVNARVAGTLARVMVHEGDRIQKGQVVIMMDDEKPRARLREAEAQLASADARLRELLAGTRAEDIEAAETEKQRAQAVYDQAKDDFERKKRLYAKEAVTLVEVQRAEERLKVALEDVKGADARLRRSRSGPRSEEIGNAKGARNRAASDVQYCASILADYIITSPIAGVVTQRLKEPGETVEVGEPIVKIIDPSKLRVHAEVEETDVGKVLLGARAEVIVDAYHGKTYKGVVTKVMPVVRRKSQKSFDPLASFDINTQELHVSLDQYEGLHDGMTVTVRFLK